MKTTRRNRPKSRQALFQGRFARRFSIAKVYTVGLGRFDGSKSRVQILKFRRRSPECFRVRTLSARRALLCQNPREPAKRWPSRISREPTIEMQPRILTSPWKGRSWHNTVKRRADKNRQGWSQGCSCRCQIRSQLQEARKSLSLEDDNRVSGATSCLDIIQSISMPWMLSTHCSFIFQTSR